MVVINDVDYTIGPKANLEGANLTGAVLTGADLTGANLYGAKLEGANLTDVKLTGANLYGAILIRANLYGAILIRAKLTNAISFFATLTGANLTGANLTGAFLTGANLSGANLYGAILIRANLKYADLTGADLTDANLTNVKSGSITGNPLSLPNDYKMTKGYIVGPDVDLTGADLTDANLTGADLTGADLTDVNLKYADLTDANLKNVDLTDANLTDALYNEKTKGLTKEQKNSMTYIKSYDYIIVGGGPAGIMATYNIATNNPEKTILLLEQNEYTLQDYKDDGYENIFNWLSAQNDSKYQNSFASTDDKSVRVGEGIGGGTNIFGLQYIDTQEIVDHNHIEWKSFPRNDVDSGENLVDSVNAIIDAQRYTYSYDGLKHSPNTKWYDLKTHIDNQSSSTGVKAYNNKIYSKDISSDERLLLGDLLTGLSNIDIEYGVSVSRLVFNSPTDVDTPRVVTGLKGFNNKSYAAKNYILCAGAIQTPAILQRSGIDCGNKLYDHAGLTFLYGKLEQQEVATDYYGDISDGYTLEELESLGLNVYNIGEGGEYDLTSTTLNSNTGKKKMYSIFRHSKLSDADVAVVKTVYNLPTNEPTLSTSNGVKYIYDMGSYWNGSGHPGGSQFRNMVDNNYDLTSTLLSRHGSHYNSRLRGKTAKLVGVLKISESSIQHTPSSDIEFEPNTIVSHIQTRDNAHKWQGYLSTAPNVSSYLIVTCAQSTNLSGSGTVKIKSQDNENPEVTLSHFGKNVDVNKNVYVNDILEAFTKNNKIMTDLGYTLLQPNPQQVTIDKDYIAQQAGSIYHYHGSCAVGEVVDENQKVYGYNNLYIGDISVLSKPWGGSTSFPALITGYIVSKNNWESESDPEPEPALSQTTVNKVTADLTTSDGFKTLLSQMGLSHDYMSYTYQLNGTHAQVLYALTLNFSNISNMHFNENITTDLLKYVKKFYQDILPIQSDKIYVNVAQHHPFHIQVQILRPGYKYDTTFGIVTDNNYIPRLLDETITNPEPLKATTPIPSINPDLDLKKSLISKVIKKTKIPMRFSWSNTM